MGRLLLIFMASIAAFVCAPAVLHAFDFTPPIVIDHRCTDLGEIPSAWIDSVQSNVKQHYAHTSHGSQLTRGLELVQAADPAYAFALEYESLPDVGGSLCVFDGQESVTYVVPEDYWNSPAGMEKTRSVLRHNPSITVSMWCWCTQLDGASAEYVQMYLDSISTLESEFPAVTFVYMTGNAQAYGWEGCNRYERNEQIRRYCASNNKVLYDFADLDCWWLNPTTEQWEHSTYEYNGTTVPVQHPRFDGAEWGHTTLESCEQKGKALWWLLVSIGGLRDVLTGVERTSPDRALVTLGQNFPNPFDAGTSIGFSLTRPCRVKLQIFSVTGRLVRTVSDGPLERGAHTAVWNGLDSRGRVVPNGVYFCRLTGSDGAGATKKMMKLR
jgi:hypothetical protein